MNKRDNYATANSTKRPRIDERRTYDVTMIERTRLNESHPMLRGLNKMTD